MLAQWFSARIALRCALGVAVTVAALAILALGPPVQRVAADSPCAPKGDEKDASKYQGSNAFYLCQEGPDHFSTPTWGPSQELFITCRPSTLRAGTKWHIWCNADGSHCACNRDDFIGGQGACCNWTPGQHCTEPGDALPGKHGCAPSW
jgi:hypothetical protein